MTANNYSTAVNNNDNNNSNFYDNYYYYSPTSRYGQFLMSRKKKRKRMNEWILSGLLCSKWWLQSEFWFPTVTALGHFPSLPLENNRTKFLCTTDRNFGRDSNEQLWQPDRASSSYINCFWANFLYSVDIWLTVSSLSPHSDTLVKNLACQSFYHHHHHYHYYYYHYSSCGFSRASLL